MAKFPTMEAFISPENIKLPLEEQPYQPKVDLGVLGPYSFLPIRQDNRADKAILAAQITIPLALLVAGKFFEKPWLTRIGQAAGAVTLANLGLRTFKLIRSKNQGLDFKG